MIRIHASTLQPEFVMPSRPTYPASVGKIFELLTSLTAFFHALTRPCYDDIRHDPILRHSTPMQHICQLRLSYGHATNATLLRYKLMACSYEKCCMSSSHPYLALQRHRPAPPSPAATKSANTALHPESHDMRRICQLRPSYDMRRMRRLTDTKKTAIATKSVARPIWRATVHHPNSRPVRHNKHYEIRIPSRDYRHAVKASDFYQCKTCILPAIEASCRHSPSA